MTCVTSSDKPSIDASDPRVSRSSINVVVRRRNGESKYLRSVTISESLLALLERQLDAVEEIERSNKRFRRLLRRAG